MKENNSHQEKAASILFQISKKANLDKINQEADSDLKSTKQNLASKNFTSQKNKIDLFFSNPKNVALLEKQFDKNLRGILEYLLERKRKQKEDSK